MGMSSSQARLLTLTARLHSIEHKAQKLEADKLRLANDSDRVYETYLERLDATKIQYRALQADGTLTFKDATLNAMENGIIGNWTGETCKDVLFLQSQNGKILVTPAVANKYGLVDSAEETRDLDTFVTETTGKTKSERDIIKQHPVEDTNVITDFTHIANVENSQPVNDIQHTYSPISNIEGGIDYSALASYAEFNAGHTASTTGSSTITNSTTALTAGATYTISDAAGLKKLAELANSTNTAGTKIILTNNIDMTGVTGWTGISNFAGTFDGNGYVISNLTGSQGLFASTSNATIQNVGLENININGNSTYVGGLIGSAYNSNVINCYTTGTVKNSNTTAASSLTTSGSNVGTGGLIGYVNFSSDDSAFKYDNIYSSANVNGYDNVGGLFGSTSSRNADFNITNAYAIGNITGHNNVGGFAGHMYNDQDTPSANTDIINSYAGGNVTGNVNVGGFWGNYLYWGDLDDHCEINGCQSTGKVNGATSNKGAFAGHLYVKIDGSVNAEEDKYINFVNCGYANNTGVTNAYGSIHDTAGNDVTSLVQSSGSAGGLTSFQMAGSVPSINADGSGDYMKNIIAALTKAGAYDPCELSATEKSAMETKVKNFLKSFADNDADNTKLWYLNKALNEYLNGSGSAGVGTALAQDIQNGTTTASASFQTGAALDGSVKRAADTSATVLTGSHNVQKGNVTIPSRNNIADQLHYSLRKNGNKIDETTVKNWINANYSTSNADDKVILANINNSIQNGTNLDAIYNAIVSNTKYTDTTLFPVDKWNISFAADRTITPTYGTKMEDYKAGTEFYWDTTDPDIANAIAMYAMAKRGVTVVTDKQAESYTWLVNMVNAGEAVFSTFNPEQVATLAAMSEDEINNMSDEEYEDLMGIKNTSVSIETFLMEVSDEKGLKKAEAQYEADMLKINKKDRYYDTQLAACENERKAIITETDTLKTVIKENVDRTFKLFS